MINTKKLGKILHGGRVPVLPAVNLPRHGLPGADGSFDLEAISRRFGY